MELFGIDIFAIIIFGGILLFEILILGFVIIFRKNIPYLPRTYYDVKIYSKEGELEKKTKAWKVTTNKTPYLRIVLKGITSWPPFNGIEKDIATLQGLNEDGVLELVEDVPDLIEETNYQLRKPPLTQRERAEQEIYQEVILPACAVEYKENEEIKTGVDKQKADVLMARVQRIFASNSRLSDLNVSAARKSYILQARRELERDKNENLILKYGPMIVLILAALFSYLMIDSAGKSYQVTTDKAIQVQQNGFAQIIEQCHGVYKPPAPQNQTDQGSGVKLPFL